MSYTPPEDLAELTVSDLQNMGDEKVAQTYKRLKHTLTADSSAAMSDHIAKLERTANIIVSERGLWSEVYPDE